MVFEADRGHVGHCIRRRTQPEPAQAAHQDGCVIVLPERREGGQACEKDDEKVISEKITKKPVDEVTLVGTKGAASAGGAGTFTDENGVKVSYSYKLTGSGTAYTAPAGALTASGHEVYEGGVAVNPALIPYGSKLYIETTDGSFSYGYATAIDTGGALMDGSAIVDLFYFSLDDCYSFGRRDVNVYVL